MRKMSNTASARPACLLCWACVLCFEPAVAQAEINSFLSENPACRSGGCCYSWQLDLQPGGSECVLSHANSSELHVVSSSQWSKLGKERDRASRRNSAVPHVMETTGQAKCTTLNATGSLLTKLNFYSRLLVAGGMTEHKLICDIN